MLLTVLVSLFCASACYSRRVESFARQEVEKGFKQNPTQYFALTSDGRLEQIQLVFPEGTEVQTTNTADKTTDFLLTPDGRLEPLKEERTETNEVTQYFRLTEDGRLQTISKEEVPVNAKEEKGEYHVLLPSGSLQRVKFMTTTKGNLQSAKVQYQEVDPITGPVYRYASPLVRIL